MSSLVYVLRGPLYANASALYSSGDSGVVTLGIEDAVTTIISSQPAEILQSGTLFPFKTRERLTYKQLLDVIIETEKVIIL